jgi:threonylcarbamoyladenosine tRNA methylthiotransferase MtaB
MRVFLTNLGCKLNQAEVETLARQFHAAGHRVVGSVEDADLHVINSCTVTHMAARGSRKVARRGARHNPHLKTVVTGCYASEDPKKVATVVGVDLVVPNDRKERLVEEVHAAFPETRPRSRSEDRDSSAEGPPKGALAIPYVPLDFGHTRALVKVEDGCNMRCSFCIIPFTRGRQTSRPVAECVAEVDSMVRAGVQEVVVTGVQISSYRSRDPESGGEQRLYDLVAALLQQTSVPRLRLTSIAPWQFDRRLLELWRDPRLCRHIHLSLQSGSSATLQRMRRPYTADRYATLVEAIREAMPGAAITTDIIVGFPGETEEEFAVSLAFAEAMEFAKIHAFPYSTRQGTMAAEMPHPVAPAVKRERMARMLAVADASERQFWQDQLGRTETVLWERRRGDLWHGLTDNYVRVLGHADEDLHNRLTPARLIGLGPGGVVGLPLVA